MEWTCRASGSPWLRALAVFLCLATCSGSAQDLAKRLILKDGSYQLATKWEVKGDRIRYFSAERDQWEEVPDALVDWDATAKYEKDRATIVPPEAVALDKELAAERQSEDAKTPQVAPGLRLPFDSTVMLLDTFNNQPQLNELDQQGGALDKDDKPSILRSTIDPLGSRKQNIEIEGPHSRVQSHVTLPAIYVNLNQATDANIPQGAQQAEQPWDRFHIVRAQEKHNKRVVGAVKVNALGKVSQEQSLVPTTSEKLAGGWIKITPTAALQAGEYAVAEMLSKDQINAYVWDFGVNPAAPANVGALLPDPSSPQPQSGKAKSINH
jgi:hypothetical protein